RDRTRPATDFGEARSALPVACSRRTDGRPRLAPPWRGFRSASGQPRACADTSFFAELTPSSRSSRSYDDKLGGRDTVFLVRARGDLLDELRAHSCRVERPFFA